MKVNTAAQAKSVLGNEHGSISLDFVFAFMFAFGFGALLFAVSVTLASVEVSQYITYAVSRAYMGAHESKEFQTALGNRKFEELLDKGVFKAFYGIGWVKLDAPQLGNFSSEYPESPASDNNIFEGARIRMDARIARIRIPMLGSTFSSEQTGVATLNSYLMREVSDQECREQFNRVRGQRIPAMDVGGAAPYGAAQNFKVVLITDNGC